MALLALGLAGLGIVPVPGWIPELLSSLLPLIGILGLTLVALALWRPSRFGLITAGLVVLLVLGRLSAGLWTRHLAPARPGDQRLSLLLINAYALNEDPESLLRIMDDQQADVTIITEPPPGLMKPLRALEEAPGSSHVLLRCPPTRGEHSWIVVRSRFPAELVTDPHDGVLDCLVLGPQGPIRLIACHLLSPRTPGRYAQAREQVARVIEQAHTEPAPLVIAGDFNAAPTSHLSSHLARQTGTRRSKPFTAGGTYPAGLPRPFRVAIDDALIGSDCSVVSWRTIGLPGSDHLGVRIDLAWRASP
ncbi:MAG: hypothetical protein DYG94_01350 [Leptolyngbya sp. PLA3]|nr:MAG: hypothetical protein EDM82_00530 [Cyanobacteria bacterium CYA]MCE7967377.1 hypothetical protein [Leptolyngbya sp. PL-A3]